MRILRRYTIREGIDNMETELQFKMFWVYVVPCKQEKALGRFTLMLKPFHHRSRTVTKRPFLFVSRRTFASLPRAKQEALWLFGPLKWERDGDNPRARVHFFRGAPRKNQRDRRERALPEATAASVF